MMQINNYIVHTVCIIENQWFGLMENENKLNSGPYLYMCTASRVQLDPGTRTLFLRTEAGAANQIVEIKEVDQTKFQIAHGNQFRADAAGIIFQWFSWMDCEAEI